MSKKNELKSAFYFQLFLIFTFGLMLISVPIYWFSSSGSGKEISLIENRELAEFPAVSFNQVNKSLEELLQGNLSLAINTLISGDFKDGFRSALERASADQFPFRLPLASLTRLVERTQIKLAYGLFDDPAFPASLGVNYLLLWDEQVYIQPPAVWDEQRKEYIDNRIENYKDLIEQFPESYFYIFYLERMAFAPYNPMIPYFPQADAGQSFVYFLENKPPELQVSSLQLRNLSEHKEKFFRTDHHWNIRGAWEAYEIIYNMLGKDIPELGPKLELSGFSKIEGVQFCGSYARRTLYPCQPDIFEYAQVDLKQYSTFVDGEETNYGNKGEYFKGNFSRDPYTGHYAEFFGFVAPQVEYHFDNPNARNLLIIGGSYTQAMQEFVASHFNKTYVVDLREYENFSLGYFIDTYGIDDVLIIGDVIVYSREGWQINP